MPPSPDVVVIGAGIVGAACAHACSVAGLRVLVLDRGGVAGGTTSAGEGNILVSDKEPGPELRLALRSAARWRDLADELGPDTIEYEAKGGVVVARRAAALAPLRTFAAAQRTAGVDVSDVDSGEVRELEPHIAPDIAGGAWYPGDAQVQPMLAAARLLAAARARGAEVATGVEVTAIEREPGGGAGHERGAGGGTGHERGAGGGTGHERGAISAVVTADPSRPRIPARWVVNAAGTWAGDVAAMAGAPVPILPRRGVILVTEPVGRAIRHKVYSAEYVANVASSEAELQTSVVVEETQAGTILIGASRERVGFDRSVSLPVIRRLAAGAVDLFPFLSDVSLLRTYLGFRPYCPDHLPIIGPDPRAPGLVYAAGHEGAGIGLAAMTGLLVAQSILGERPDMDLAPFRPGRFEAAA